MRTLHTGLFAWLCAALSVALVASAFYRAATISFTHDESLSYNLFMHETLADVIALNTPTLFPNNHILNTLAMRAADAAFGPAELSLRLASVLSLPLFLVFAFLIAGRYPRGPWKTVTFLLLALNPYLLELFCLARGYAMASAFLLGGVWFFLRAQEDVESPLLPSLAIVFATLATFSHLTFLVPGAILVAMTFAMIAGDSNPGRRLLAPSAVTVLAAAALFSPLRRMLEIPRFEGVGSSRWQDTVESLTRSWQSHPAGDDLGGAILLGLVMLWALAGALYVTAAIVRRRLAALSDPAVAATALVLSCALANWIQFQVLGIPYLKDRFATFYLPLCALSLGLLLDRLAGRLPQRAGAAAAVAIAVLLPVHTGGTLNFSYLREGRHEAGLRRVLASMEGDWRGRGLQRPAKVWLAEIYRPSVEFYRRYLALEWLEPADDGDIPDGTSDYYLVTRDQVRLIPAPHRAMIDDTTTMTALVGSAP